MAKRYEKLTAEQFLRSLEADPDYRRRRSEQDEALAKLDALYRQAEAPLVSDLANLGISVESVWTLVNGPNSYDKAIPLLLDHLQRPYPDAIRDGIARALGVPAAGHLGWRILVDEYHRVGDKESRVKDGLAAALSGASNDSVIQELIALVKDKFNGNSRLLLLLGIKRSKRPEALQAITELADDPQLAKEIRSWRKTGK